MFKRWSTKMIAAFIVIAVAGGTSYYLRKRRSPLEVVSCKMLQPSKPKSIQTRVIASGFQQPVILVFPPKGLDGFVVGEKTGRLWKVENGERTQIADFSKFLDTLEFENGLLGFAFHPQFARNGRVFVYYTPPVNGRRLSEFYADPKTWQISKNSEKILIDVQTETRSHNGGHIEFDTKGMLLISMGDGNHKQPAMRAQDRSHLRGKILRIDVDGRQKPYAIPKDNPFVNEKDVRGEIWAYGFRNPWRFTVDHPSDRIIAGDVGDLKAEEINLVEKGGNYGWPVYEGSKCRTGDQCESVKGIAPLLSYRQPFGNSVIGGVVYRGQALPELNGRYIFSDYGGLALFISDLDQPKDLLQVLVRLPDRVSTLAKDQHGEVYFTMLEGGSISQLVPATSAEQSFELVEQLSESGCLPVLTGEKKAANVFPYKIRSGEYRDGLVMHRAVYFPQDQRQPLAVTDDGFFKDYSEGTVFFQTISSEQGVPIETRVSVFSGDAFEYAAYRYNIKAKEAFRIASDQTIEVKLSLKAAKNPETYSHQYYGPQTCLGCHLASHHQSILGFNQLQLDVGSLSQLADVLPTTRVTAQVSDYRDVSQSVELRARGFLHSHCSHCHNAENSQSQATLDLRYHLPIEKMGICHQPVVNPMFDSKLVLLAPGDPERSVLYQRIVSDEMGKHMPPFGGTKVDRVAAEVIQSWISSMASCGS